MYCYDPSQDNWTTLPSLSVRYFGLGKVDGKLAAIGGCIKNFEVTNNVYTYDERSQKWKKTVPPMPTARYFPGVLSLQSALVVAGGKILLSDYAAVVEIFKPDSSQWYKTDPLPTACRRISLVATDNKCYALGGFDGSWFDSAFYTAVDDLLIRSVPANQTTRSSRISDTRLAWKALPNTPTYGPAAAVLGGHLLAVGGKENSKSEGTAKKEVFMYSPSINSWIYVSDLPTPQSTTTITNLSSNEVLVIGGWDGKQKVKTIYACTLLL